MKRELKKLSDLKIGDQIYMILHDGRVITDYVETLNSTVIRTDKIYANYEKDKLSFSGSLSSNFQNYNIDARSNNIDYKFGDIHAITSDYRLSIKIGIDKTREAIEVCNNRLTVLTNNALKDVQA